MVKGEGAMPKSLAAADIMQFNAGHIKRCHINQIS